jgi:hypothetical protein
VLRKLAYSQSIQPTRLPGEIKASTSRRTSALVPLPLVTSTATTSAKTQVTRVLHVQDGRAISVNVSMATPTSQATVPADCYKRLRMLVSLGFLLMLLVTLFVQSGLADGTWQNISQGLSYLRYGQLGVSDIHMDSHLVPINASQTVVRISQLDPAQYNSTDEYNTWAYSACSAAAMTEVFDAYGRHFRITDVLTVEAHIGAITPQLGLLDPSGIQATAAQFGFKTTWSNSWDLDTIITIANGGKPVIVSFPPDRYDGGHLLVVLGGNSSVVYLADTSLWNRHVLSRGQFLNWWEGFGAVVTPT